VSGGWMVFNLIWQKRDILPPKETEGISDRSGVYTRTTRGSGGVSGIRRCRPGGDASRARSENVFTSGGERGRRLEEPETDGILRRCLGSVAFDEGWGGVGGIVQRPSSWRYSNGVLEYSAMALLYASWLSASPEAITTPRRAPPLDALDLRPRACFPRPPTAVAGLLATLLLLAKTPPLTVAVMPNTPAPATAPTANDMIDGLFMSLSWACCARCRCGFASFVALFFIIMNSRVFSKKPQRQSQLSHQDTIHPSNPFSFFCGTLCAMATRGSVSLSRRVYSEERVC
jgi:hypothetical protein